MVSKFLTDLPKKIVPNTKDIVLIEDIDGSATKTVTLSNLREFLFDYVVPNLSATNFTATNTLTTSICAISGNSSIPFTLSFTNGLLTDINWG